MIYPTFYVSVHTLLMELEMIEKGLPLVKGCGAGKTLEHCVVMRSLGRVGGEQGGHTGGVAGVEEAGVRETEGGGAGEVVESAGESGETSSGLEGRGGLGRCCRGPLGLDLLAVLRVEQLKQRGAVPCQLLLLLRRRGLLLLLLLLRPGRGSPLLWLLLLLLGTVVRGRRGLLGHFVVDLRKLTLRLPLPRLIRDDRR